MTDSDAQQGASGHSATSARAIILGFIFAIGHVFWLVTLEQYWYKSTGTPSVYTLVYTAVFIFFWLIVINRAIQSRWPNSALARGELLTIFTMMTVGCALAGTAMVPTLAQLTMEPYYNIPLRHFDTTVLPYVTPWLVVNNQNMVVDYFKGHSSIFSDGYIRNIAGPFGWWMIFFFFLLLMVHSANAILRRQWSRNEHLSFPVTQLPIAMSSSGAGSLFTLRLFWIGFAVAAGITLMSGMYVFFPSWPRFQVRSVADLWNFLPPEPAPWRWMGSLNISLQPFAIGLAFLIPLDLLFSFWFFTWIWGFERVWGRAFTNNPSPWSNNPGFPYHGQQMMGVMLALLLLIIWTGRGHLSRAFQQALHPRRDSDDVGDAISYRFAFLGFALGLLGSMGFFFAMKITAMLVIFYTIMLLAVLVVVARIRAEFGPPVQDLLGGGPDRGIEAILSPAVTGLRAWVSWRVLTFWLSRDAYSTYPSAAHMDALKIGEVSGGLNRRYWIALLVVGILGGVIAYWWTLYLGFKAGPTRGVNGFPSQCMGHCAWRYVLGDVDSPVTKPSVSTSIAMSLGFLGTVAIYFVRSRGIYLPINPIAYPLTAGVVMRTYWFPIFLAWLFKLLIMRYGGLRLFRSMLPFFFGLILGEFVVGVCWQILGAILNITTYSFA
jgi:hypothetical protein